MSKLEEKKDWNYELNNFKLILNDFPHNKYKKLN